MSLPLNGCTIVIECFERSPNTLHHSEPGLELLVRRLIVTEFGVPQESALGEWEANTTDRKCKSRTVWSFDAKEEFVQKQRKPKERMLLTIQLHQKCPPKMPEGHESLVETGFEARDQVLPQDTQLHANDGFEYDLPEQIARHALTRSFLAPEALTAHLADEAFLIADAKYPQANIQSASITISKSDAFTGVVKIKIHGVRLRSQLGHSNESRLTSLNSKGKHRAMIGLGGNMGNRISSIEEACRILDSRGINVVKTSSLYETEAMYVIDQEPFINGVCEVSESP